MPTSTIYRTINNPIPTWKGPEESGCVPTVLITGGSPPPISGADDTIVDFHCADTFDRTGGIIDSDKILGNIFDDQM
jgi:hypothetical protein